MIIISNKHEVFKTSTTDLAIHLNCQLLLYGKLYYVAASNSHVDK